MECSELFILQSNKKWLLIKENGGDFDQSYKVILDGEGLYLSNLHQ